MICITFEENSTTMKCSRVVSEIEAEACDLYNHRGEPIRLYVDVREQKPPLVNCTFS